MAVFIDYSKDFDTVRYETLINKWANLNFGNSLTNIILSCRGNTQQYAQLVDKKAPYQPIYIGVAQGSILGPALFDIYVSSLASCLKSNSIQYADDTSLYLSNSSEISNLQYQFSKLTLKI